jgi:hypothetical protein
MMLLKSFFWLALLSGPLAILTSLFCFVHRRLRLESQLLDHWWRIHLSEIEIIRTLRKSANDGSLVTNSEGSVVSSAGTSFQRRAKRRITNNDDDDDDIDGMAATAGDKTEVTRATDTTNAWASSATDVCYGNITLGIFKLTKVALKPISTFHQSRKLMIELRGVSGHHREGRPNFHLTLDYIRCLRFTNFLFAQL